MARAHDLKTWPEPFQAVRSHEKRFEIRRNDRDYQVGDILILREFDPDRDAYSGEACERRVTFMLAGGQFGLESGFVALGIEPIGEADSVRQAFENEMAEEAHKAWDAMSRYKFWMFGYHASGWVKVHRLSGLDHPNPFADFVALARERGYGPPGTHKTGLLTALRLAKSHIEHMGAFITAQSAGYSFEALGEDMPSIDAAISFLSTRRA